MNVNSREKILRRIKTGLCGDVGHKESSDPLYGPETVAERARKIRKENINYNNNNVLEQLLEELSNVNSEVYRAGVEDDIFEFVKGLIRSKDIKSFTAWDSEYLRSLNLNRLLADEGLEHIISDDKYKIAEAQIGITGADYAIADTGTLVLLSDGSKPRSVSLLPPIHLAIVRKANIVSNINELFTVLEKKHDAENLLPSCMTFITGPSRTADIELNLTLGVHGPKELHVIITSD